LGADVEHAEVRRGTGRTEHAHHRSKVRAGRQLGRVDVVTADAELLPPRQRVGEVAGLVRVAATHDDLADAAAAHHFADLDCGQVALATVEPRADRGVHAEVHRADEGLAFGQDGNLAVDEGKVVVIDEPFGPAREAHLAIELWQCERVHAPSPCVFGPRLGRTLTRTFQYLGRSRPRKRPSGLGNWCCDTSATRNKKGIFKMKRNSTRPRSMMTRIDSLETSA
jgi:hypothetical protein